LVQVWAPSDIISSRTVSSTLRFNLPVAGLETESVPSLVREGQRIIVPDGSPLRGKLTIEPVTTKEVQRNLTLPAVVEADPARLVKVLPPLVGRTTQLKVPSQRPPMDRATSLSL
jgi:hypothetical protein